MSLLISSQHAEMACSREPVTELINVRPPS